jgi:hypothetical protein
MKFIWFVEHRLKLPVATADTFAGKGVVFVVEECIPITGLPTKFTDLIARIGNQQ